MNTDQRRELLAHLSLLGAACFWGLMAPLGKDAMAHGISGLTLVTCRLLGGTALFWLASLFAPRECVEGKDKIRFIFAGIFGLLLSQCGYIIGLSLTSPVNAGIVTTTMPIFAMILSALILKEPISGKKAGGVFLGCCGALLLVLGSARGSGGALGGNLWGDLICMGGQVSYALYLALFSPLARKYSIFTVNKWMFLWASVLVLPWTAEGFLATPWEELSLATYLEVGYVVFFGTFICYLLMINGQRSLRPTVVGMYNYIQPIVAVLVSVLLGLAVFGWMQLGAILLVFLGVWLVTISRARGAK